MAQFVRGSPDLRYAGTEVLANALGMGLGQGLNTYFANRSLESVLQDKSLEKAPISKKLEAMRSALSPYGENGQRVLQQRMQIEQQEMQEKEVEKQEKLQRIKGKAIGKLQKGEELSDEEWARFTPQEVAAIHKAYNPKPIGGLTGQAVPPDVSNAINQVLNNSPGASSDELKNAMDQAGIPPIYSNGYVENRRRSQDTGAEHDIKFHQESAKFEQEVTDHANTARRQLPLIDKSIKAVSEGKINPGSLANVFTFFGERGKKISNALLSKDESALISSIPEFLEGRKELFGVRLSDADLRLLQDKLPDIGKSKEANLAVLDLMKSSANKALNLENVAQNVLERTGLPYRSGKLRPLGFEREVMKAFDESQQDKNIFAELPPASQYVGRVMEDDDGNRFKSNGTNWERI